MLSPLDVTMASRHEPSSSAEEYVTMKPLIMDHKKQLFRGREVNGCMPKGFRHSSAPSRYVNYQTMGSLGCSTSSTSRHSNSRNKP
ncbi:hypothetical protein RHGRI_036571 [Rhododendron griersonianum]|nr:hypothetical protein RHGRI_036571 [Rhododendron griersonianum]